jgi:hypothetical protein
MRLAGLAALSSLILAGSALAGAAHAERVCTASAADPAITVALHIADDGMVEGGEVHWAVPNVRPDLPSMVHIVYPQAGDRAGSRPQSIITLNTVTGDDIARSSTASIEIVVDGTEQAVRAWDLYGQTVQQLNDQLPPQGISKASFLGAVPFTPNYEDGKRDIDSSAALTRIGDGARTLEVRLLGKDGAVLQDHTYMLSEMTAPPAKDVQTALAASLKMSQQDPGRCQMF